MRTRKVNRETALLRKFKKSKKILRRCYFLEQPGSVIQYIVCFLEWHEVIRLQKTCKFFQRRFIELLETTEEGFPRRIKANVSCINRTFNVNLRGFIENYSHIQDFNARCCKKQLEILKDMAKRQTHPKLSIETSAILDDSDLNTLKPYKLILSTPTPLAKIKHMFDGLNTLNVKYYDAKLSEEDLDVLKDTKLEVLHMLASEIDSRVIHIPNLHFLQNPNLTDVSVIGSATSKVRRLNIPNSKVKDVSMLGNLEMLSAVNVKTLTVVSALGRLHQLNLSGTNVVDVSMLGNVHTLDLSRTKVTDVSALSGVHTLNISHTNVEDVSTLGHVHELDISGTKVKDVSMLGNVYELTFRGIDPNIDISALNHVNTLDLSQSDIADLDTLSKNPNMFAHIHTLILNSTKVKDIKKLKRVHTLHLLGTNVEDVSTLTHVRELVVTHRWQRKIRGLDKLKRIKQLTVNSADVGVDAFRKLKANVLYTDRSVGQSLREQGWTLCDPDDENVWWWAQRWVR